MSTNAADRVAVLGGGLAGLAAALQLSKAGVAVDLFEKRELLGGRASSFVDPEDGELVDSCQHVSMRCCTELQEFFREIGATDLVEFHREIPFLDVHGRWSLMRSVALPVPFHFLPSLICFRGLSLREKVSLVKVVMEIWRMGAQIRSLRAPELFSENIHGIIFSEKTPALAANEFARRLDGVDFLFWLKEQGQSEGVIRRFWEPLLISALNESLDRVSALLAIETVYWALLSNRDAYQVGVPLVSLAEIFSGRGKEALERRGVRFHFRETVSSFVVDSSGAISALKFNGGSSIETKRVVCTIPFQYLSGLLPGEWRSHEYFDRLQLLKTSPILGIHLWFDRAVLDRAFVALLGTRIQWIFAAKGNHLSLVISAAREFEGLSREALLKIALEDLHCVLPASKEAKLLKSRVIKERQATFSAVPQVDSLRPGPRSPIAGLYLAGDWTATGWPATMEGAVRSGNQAAKALLRG